MRDRRKFGRPRVLKYPKTGDIVTSLKNGESLVVSPKNFERIKRFFKINTFFKSSFNTAGNIKVISKKFGKEAYFTPIEYTNILDDFEINEVVGSIAENNAVEGNIICYNSNLNIEAIFTYSDWLNLYDWDAIGLFGIETFDEDDEVTEERYVILANGETFIIKASDYSKVSSQWEHVDTILYDPTMGYEYVDLGLPSGTLWATMNVGANSETDYGNYYQYGKGSALYATTVEDPNYTGTEDPLALNADTARQVWGGGWHMPTETLFNELLANTDYTFTTINDVSGGKFTSKTDNSKYVFFPAAGTWNSGNLNNVGTFGYYLSSTYPLHNSGPKYLSLFNGGNYVSTGDFTKGYSIRPVIETN